MKSKHKLTDDLIHLALDELKANDLLIDYRGEHFKGLSRREAIRKVGLSTMIALPLISSLLAPTAAMAASACPSGQTLCSGNCVNTNTSNSNCGSCGFNCSGGSVCSGGICRNL